MRKLALALCVFMVIMLVPRIPAFAENTVSVPRGRPVIDGEIDPVWDFAAQIKLEHITIDSPKKDDKHATATAKLLWDEQYVYCLVAVKDATYSDAGTDWSQDCVEYFIDALNTKSKTLQGSNNAQYCLTVSGSVFGTGSFDEAAFRKNAVVKRTPDGYLEEVAIPLASHNVSGKVGMKIGFDFQVDDDRDNDGKRDYILTWNEDGDAYQDPSQLGTIMLADPMPGAPACEPIAAATPAPTARPTAAPEKTLKLSVGGSDVMAYPPTFVPTFECLGFYWNPGIEGQDKLSCAVQYRAKGSEAWKNALELWYDSRAAGGRPTEFRGSIVGLKPGTEYEVKLALSNGAETILPASTMSEEFPLGETVTLSAASSETLYIDQGGTPDAYRLYTFDSAAGSSVIDVNNGADTCVTVAAPYVIIRGLTLKGAKKHGIDLIRGAHHVVIEDCDVSNWGTFRDEKNGWGADMQAGIHAMPNNPEIKDIVIQRNRIHDPRTSANPWDYGHPAGPQGISFEQDGGGHNIIRYNEVTGSDGNFFNDCIGGAENYSYNGFPGPDSDVYGNLVRCCYDDALEIEGGGMNVRVWGNYMDATGTGVSSACVSVGPLYIFRNIYDTSRMRYFDSLDNDTRGGFGKAGDKDGNPAMGGGRRYYFHNTALQAPPPEGSKLTLGEGEGVYDAGGPLTNIVSRNNIWQVWVYYSCSIDDRHASPTNSFDYDLFNGRVDAYKGAEEHGVKGVPVYAPGNGWESHSGGLYALDSSSPGYRAAEPIPNFNDMFAAPDIGAHQSGTPPMQFGVNAWRAGPPSWADPTAAPSATPPSAPAAKPALAPGVSLAVPLAAAAVLAILAAVFLSVRSIRKAKARKR